MKVAELLVRNIRSQTGFGFTTVKIHDVDSVHHMRNHIIVLTKKGEEHGYESDRVVEYKVKLEYKEKPRRME